MIRLVMLLVVLMAPALVEGQELLWKNPEHDLLFVSVSKGDGGSTLVAFIDPSHIYQRAREESVDYEGRKTVTRYYEVFRTKPSSPATHDGWRTRSSLFIYPVSVFDYWTPSGEKWIVIRGDGSDSQYLIVIGEKGEKP